MLRAAASRSLTLRRAGSAVAGRTGNANSSGGGGGELRCSETLRVVANGTAQQQRFMSAGGGGFLRRFYDNLKQDLERNKEMKDSLKKFKEEAAKLEQTEALQKARKKFKTIEEESSSKVAENLQKLRDQVGETIEKSRIGEEVSKTAEAAKRTLEDMAQKGDELLSKSETLKAVSKSIEGPTIYRAPEVLLRRSMLSAQYKNVVVEANTEAQGVELHADSKWAEGWENFKSSNPYYNKIMDMRLKLEESENPMVRASRAISSKVSELVGDLFETTDLSKAYTEICKVDPSFDKTQFLRFCETQVIPTVLEAMIRPDLDILKDWLHEAPYRILSTPIMQAMKSGLKIESKILDVTNVEIYGGQVLEQGPVLLIVFVAQHVECIRDKANKVVAGDPEKIMRVNHVWTFCRDPNELNPIAAWRILDIQYAGSHQPI